jgi:lipoate synthase
MLEPSHRDFHDSGQRLYAPLRLLRGAEGRAARSRLRRAAPRGRSRGRHGLRFAVITSVNRDDRADGGAELFALTIRAIRERIAGCGVEVLVPDFQGSHAAMDIVMAAAPDVLNHNTETVPRLYRQVRLGARYERSLDMLAYAKSVSPRTPVKSGLMLGLAKPSTKCWP